MEDKFPKGISISKPHGNAPVFVKARLGINVQKAVEWLEQVKNENGYVNIDVLLSKEGNLYLKHNDFKPEKKKEDWTTSPTEEFPNGIDMSVHPLNSPEDQKKYDALNNV